MRDRYIDLIEQTYYFPQDGFDLEDNWLRFHKIDLKHVIEQHGAPLKITYLPKIGENTAIVLKVITSLMSWMKC